MRFRPSLVLMVVAALVALLPGCERSGDGPSDKPAESADTSPSPRIDPAKAIREPLDGQAFVGSASCRSCHADFYALWATSHHGLAMQPYTPEFARTNLTPQSGDIAIGAMRYQVEIDDTRGSVRQRGPDGEKTYPIAQVMGGKNVYYLLTPMERGRLQVLPLAYDAAKRAWYDMASSGVRHFPDRRDEALPWTDRMFSFNTTCFNCHVSQLRTNYDLTTDTYHTTWSEPGISCESCHGPAGEHVRAMALAPHARDSKDIKILRAEDFSADQISDMCATCHAKLVPLSLTFLPGQRYFDHFDLVVLDHPDYYPDGRDLGEDYTFTSWLMSPCAKSGKLDCNHCHTPSGRPRFEGPNANQACAPCHQNHVDDPPSHGHHAPGSPGNDCIGCHMPMTRFAAMGRSDHSMRPPTPATTLSFKSPNACNLCHTEKDAAWADSWVRTWYARDFQTTVVARAALIEAGRKEQWQHLPPMLEKIADRNEDAVYKASLVRLLAPCHDESKWPALVTALDDPSPLVRSSAVSALAGRLSEATIPKLLTATRDPVRLVRIRAAAALAPLSADRLAHEQDRASLARATEEFRAAMQARPDDWAGYANLGNFCSERGAFLDAIHHFDVATRLEPRAVGPMVNASIAYSNLHKNDKAEVCLRRALAMEPSNVAALLNLGLLLAEERREAEAETALRAALKADPTLAAAAFNLGVLCGEKRIDEAITWCRKACELEPGNAKYAQALAFFVGVKGQRKAP